MLNFVRLVWLEKIGQVNFSRTNFNMIKFVR